MFIEGIMTSNTEIESVSNDTYNLSQFSESHINKIIDKFKGIDRVVYEYLIENKLISEMDLRQSCMEMKDTGQGFASLMAGKGAVDREALIELGSKVDPRELSTRELIDPSIPFTILKENKIMLHDVTLTHVYVSTGGSENIARRVLKPHFPDRIFKFLPYRVKAAINYMESIEKYGKQEGTLLEVLIRKAILDKVSDIHVYPSRTGYNVKVRYLGQLYVERVGGLDEYLSLTAKGKLSAKMDATDRSTPQDGQFDIDYNGRRVDLRVATCPTLHQKETMVIRILDPLNSQVHFKDLGITKSNEIERALRSPNGVVLICGVTGSGKTTTVTSALRWVLDRYSMAINTIEDPVENELNDIKQTQINHRAGVTFPKVLRSILRQDPDVVVVGELRDDETAQIAFQGAETGHLLVGTLHVKDVRGVVGRLEKMGVERERILTQLRGILVQKLIRVVCPSCHGKGCPSCKEKGYTARTVVSEAVYLSGPEDVEKLVDRSKSRWWDTIVEDAYKKYRKGVTDRREMIRSFGPDFEDHEEKDAIAKLDEVKSGQLQACDFEDMFPVHKHLIED
jgi:general secretion pathway protein E